MIATVAKEQRDEAHELRELYEGQLRELYWSERTMVPMLSDVSGNVYSADLLDVINNVMQKTVMQAGRLEQLFFIAGIEAETTKSEAVECLLKESDRLMIQTRRGVVRDAGVISVLQKIKHYEIACYGTMRAYAKALREEDAVTLLEETLEEEKQLDLALSAIAESHINIEAADKEI